MSIARAFTKRPKRPEVSAPIPHREGHAVYSSGTIKRGKISGPVELLSTTNQLVYNAPDLHPPTSSSSSSSSLRSSNSSEPSHTPYTMHSPITPPETSPVEECPAPEPNHLSAYFKAPQRSGTVNSTSTSHSTTSDSPAIPHRSLSHTKKSHQDLAQKKSRSRMTPPPSTLPKPNSLRTSHEFFKPVADPSSHPFGKELEQVNEVAEDFGARIVLDEEEELLMKKGLRKFSVEDYLSEIEDLYGGVFEDQLGPLSGAWI
ncbi:hypothetical protein FQN54_008311 [Arachnomyces sp. PD_36]|nr:hypothetical protein FQN54_008311 [Arachnomyces sp. PD_36]